jgi:hypothetical protein
MIACALLLIAVTACSTGASQGGEGLSQAEAVDQILKEVVKPDSLNHEVIVFAWPTPLGAGDDLAVFNPPEITDGSPPLNIREDSWFFWVDDAPGARFAHPARMILVDQASGQLTVESVQWWPVLNGENLWIELEEYWDEGNWVYTNVEWRPELPSGAELDLNPQPIRSSSSGVGVLAYAVQPFSQEGRNRLQAIVISGEGHSQSQNDEFATDSINMLAILKDAGFETSYFGQELGEIGGLADRKSPFDYSALGDRFQENWETLQPGDTLFVYITGHGYISEEGEGVAAGIGEELLKIWLGTPLIDPGVNIILVVDACYSGSVEDTAKTYADLTITSTNSEDPAWFDRDDDNDPNPEDAGGEFSSGFVEGWKRIMADPAERARIEKKATDRGISYFQALAGDAAVVAAELDAGLLNGKSFPMIIPGLPSTHPVAAGGTESVTYVDPLNDVFSCQSGEVVPGSIPAHADIGAVSVHLDHENQLIFTIEFSQLETLEQPILGSVEFDDPTIPNSELNPEFIFSNKGEYDLNFHFLPPDPLNTEAYAYIPDSGWTEDMGIEFSAQTEGNTIILEVPVDTLPPVQNSTLDDLRFWVGAATVDLQSCDAALWDESGTASGILPLSQLPDPADAISSMESAGIEYIVSDDPADAIVCSTQGVDAVLANDPQVEIVSIDTAWSEDAWQFKVEMGAPLDPEDYSFALQLLFFSDHEDVDRLYLWEMHAGEFRIGELDTQTGDLIAGEDEGILIENDYSGVFDVILNPRPFPARSTTPVFEAWGVASYHTRGAGDQVNCDLAGTFDFPTGAQGGQ